MLLSAFLAVLVLANVVECGRLQVSGDHFVKDGHRVFLSGVNLAWVGYAYDFGNNNFAAKKSSYERYLKELHASGGNSMRIWIHMQGESNPEFDSNGFVIGTDKARTFISDIKELLSLAQKYDILIFFCLWNGATKNAQEYRLDGLIRDTSKLHSYINHALIPWVKAVKGHPAVGGWDIINEPEGLLNSDRKSNNPCYDGSYLKDQGAGWAGKLYNFEDILRFINWQADAIRQADPGALVTVGSWKMRALTDKLGMHNHYSDHCLTLAGNKQHGILQFFQVHTYDWQGHFDPLSPFKHRKSDYGLSKPLIVGEFAARSGEGMSIESMFRYAYNNGYSGAWSWAATDNKAGDPWDTQKRGVASIRNSHDGTKGTVHLTV